MVVFFWDGGCVDLQIYRFRM
uniref:Uncharacterized protein n=1 Tax=Anguilla anguilla TaxID=7936 RepID=A0A0E9V3Q4_ANGAN